MCKCVYVYKCIMCISVYVYMCICVFVYIYVCVFVYKWVAEQEEGNDSHSQARGKYNMIYIYVYICMYMCVYIHIR